MTGGPFQNIKYEMTMFIKSAYRICPSSGDEPDYREIIPDANMRRRMGRIVRMGVAAALKCTEPFPDISIGAVIAATSMGCLADTGKFLDEISDRNESMLNPSPFIYSTFNTIAGQIAIIKGIRAYNMTYVNRGNGFSDALVDAWLCLGEGKDNILVVSYDESTPVSTAIMERLGCNYIPDAEAVAFLFSSSDGYPCPDPLEGCLDPGTRLAGMRDMGMNVCSADLLYRQFISGVN